MNTFTIPSLLSKCSGSSIASLASAACLLATASLGHAAVRASANYSITAETFDAGGQTSTSAAYSAKGGAGGIGAISTGAAVASKSGYMGQLYETSSLLLAAAPGTIDELGTRQLSASLLLDDATSLPVSASAVSWSVQSGPLGGITSGGLITASPVFQNSAATVQGLYGGFSGTLGLTVLDTVPDNFGAYAGDGIGDDWQVQYFGQNNPAAAQTMDPDGDGQNNLFEFTAGLIPTDRTSVFTVSLNIPIGQPAQRAVVFTPRLAGRTYTVKTSTTLTGWTDLAGATVSDNGTERTVTDVNASGSRQFYRVDISLP